MKALACRCFTLAISDAAWSNFQPLVDNGWVAALQLFRNFTAGGTATRYAKFAIADRCTMRIVTMSIVQICCVGSYQGELTLLGSTDDLL